MGTTLSIHKGVWSLFYGKRFERLTLKHFTELTGFIIFNLETNKYVYLN